MRNYGTSATPTDAPSPQNSTYEASNESEEVRAERRFALQQEAERMREMLAAKERELAELSR